MKTNRLSLLLAGLLVCGPAIHATAQAKPAGLGPGTSIDIGGGVSDFHIDYGKRWLGGAHVWVDGTFHKYYSLEAETTWMNHNTDENVHATTYMLGPRVSYFHGPIELYGKGMVGRGEFNFPFNYATGSYFVYSFGGGVDLRLNDRFKVRLFDMEYQRWPQFTYGAITTYGASVGISYTIYRGPSWLSR